MSKESPDKRQNSRAMASLVKVSCDKYVTGHRILNNNDVDNICRLAGLRCRTNEPAKKAWEKLVSGGFVLSVKESDTEVMARMAKEVAGKEVDGKVIPKSKGYGDDGKVFYVQPTILDHESLVELSGSVVHYKYLLDIFAKDDAEDFTVSLRDCEVAVHQIFGALTANSTGTSENTKENLKALSVNAFDIIDDAGFDELIARMEFMLVPKDEEDTGERIYAIAAKFLEAPLFGKEKDKKRKAAITEGNLRSVTRKEN